MKYEIEELKELIESGDKASIDTYLYKAIEKEDVALVQKINADVRSAIDSEKDTHANKHLETWKANHLDTLVEEEVKKRNPEKTPEQIEIEKLRAEIAAERKEREREALKTSALETLTKESLPTDLLEKLIGDDADTTTSNVELFKSVVEKVKQSTLDSVYGENGGTPERSTDKSADTTDLSELAAAANLRNN